MADYVLYGMHLSPFVRKAAGVLAHGGLEYDFEEVNIMGMPDWFLEISPMKRIPVLRDKSVGTEGELGTIADSTAIALYLNAKCDLGLYGSTPYDLGRISAIEEFADMTMALPIGMGMFRPVMFPLFAGKESDVDTARKTWHETLPPLFDYLEQTLDGGEHFYGDAYSIADISVGAQLTQIELVAGLPDAAKWPALVKHTQAMQERPGFKEGLTAGETMLRMLLPERLDLS
ncbi:MAG: glutathione S-transferase family protein [Alphaproteobacteria bacterium]